MIPPIPGNPPQINLINECSRGFSELNMDALGTLMHEDFSNVIHPKSLGVPALNKEAWAKQYADLGTGYGLTYHSVIEAPGKIVIHATTEVENPYQLDTKCEVIYIVHFATDDDGSLKLKQVDEFNDSRVYSGIRKALAEANARK